MDIGAPTHRLKTQGETAVIGTQSVQRAVAVLRYVACAPEVPRLSDIAQALDIDVTTAHRIVKGLCFEGMLRREPDSRRYRLGRVVHELGLAATPQFPLRDLCRPTLERLAARSGDSVFLLVRSGLEIVCLERVAGSFPIQAHTLDAGARRPLGVGAGGLAMLMVLPDAEVEAVVLANDARYRAWPGLDAQRMRELVAQSRRAGYAINDGDLMPDVGAIGMAFETRRLAAAHGGPVQAAISIASLAARFRGPRRAEMARELAAEIRRLGLALAQ